MNDEVERPPTGRLQRRTLKSRIAEQIAVSADRLERQAADVRANDKQLALQLMKEATRLRRVARGIDIQHKRAERARMRRGTPSQPTPGLGQPAPTWITLQSTTQSEDTQVRSAEA